MFEPCENLSSEQFSFVSKALYECFRRNPDPTVSVGRLISRADTDLIVMFNGKKATVVAELMADDYGSLYFFVWGIYSETPLDIDDMFNSVYHYAKSLNCCYVEFGAQRTGWGKALEGRGVIAQPATIYRKFIDAESDQTTSGAA